MEWQPWWEPGLQVRVLTQQKSFYLFLSIASTAPETKGKALAKHIFKQISTLKQAVMTDQIYQLYVLLALTRMHCRATAGKIWCKWQASPNAWPQQRILHGWSEALILDLNGPTKSHLDVDVITISAYLLHIFVGVDLDEILLGWSLYWHPHLYWSVRLVLPIGSKTEFHQTR